ncbi:hypothetical protein [Chitinophaga sancti]|uniref:hypothetical protein n=1 Tax=Chitinophaga sancti TaxID=1004 RepID=UPI003F78F2DA
MKRVLLLMVVMCWLSGLHPVQSQDLEDAITTLKYIKEIGRSTPYGFDLKYSYANESKPAVILGSLNGSIELDGNNYYCLMDSTESIRTEKYNIILFHEDKLMLLGGASPDSAVDPILYMQSMIAKSGAQKCNVSHKGPVKIANIYFLPGSPCKSMKMEIDTVAHHLLSVEYLLKTVLLLDPSAQQEGQVPEGYDEFALVRATFYNYHPLKDPAARFKEEQYFYKDGAEYKPTTAYSGFQVVLSTPNL